MKKIDLLFVLNNSKVNLVDFYNIPFESPVQAA